EAIAVVPIQTVLRGKPDESTIVLHDFGDSCLRNSLCARESRKAKVLTIYNVNLDNLRGDACLCNIPGNDIGRRRNRAPRARHEECKDECGRAPRRVTEWFRINAEARLHVPSFHLGALIIVNGRDAALILCSHKLAVVVEVLAYISPLGQS